MPRTLSILRREPEAASALVGHVALTDVSFGALLAASLGLEDGATAVEGSTALGCEVTLVSDATTAALIIDELQKSASERLFGLRAEGVSDAPLSILQLASSSRVYVFDVATLHCNAAGRLAMENLVRWLLTQRGVRQGVHLAALLSTFPEAFGQDAKRLAMEVSARWLEAGSLMRVAYPQWPLGRIGSQLGSLAAYALSSEVGSRRLGRRALSVDASKLKRPLRPADVDALALRASLLIELASAVARRGAPTPNACPLQLSCQCTADAPGEGKRSLGRSIIDVGAQHGVCGKAMQRAAAAGEGWLPVVYIEPDEASLARIECQAGDVLIGAACAPQDGWAQLNLYQPGTHSLLPVVEANLGRYIDGYTGRLATAEAWRSRASVPVRCFRLETICDELGIDEIATLKVDTQVVSPSNC